MEKDKLREQLIDFLIWYDKRLLFNSTLNNALIDEYLKSINKSDNPIEHKENKLCKYDNKLLCSIAFDNLCNVNLTNYINCKFSEIKQKKDNPIEHKEKTCHNSDTEPCPYPWDRCKDVDCPLYY